MKKLISLVLVFMIGVVVSGCTTEQRVTALETTYQVGKVGVQAFVSEEKRDKYNTKVLDTFATDSYFILKDGVKDKD